jgi:hypothetical protein
MDGCKATDGINLVEQQNVPWRHQAHAKLDTAPFTVRYGVHVPCDNNQTGSSRSRLSRSQSRSTSRMSSSRSLRSLWR